MLQNVNHSASFQLKPEDIVSDWDKEASRGTVKSLWQPHLARETAQPYFQKTTSSDIV